MTHAPPTAAPPMTPEGPAAAIAPGRGPGRVEWVDGVKGIAIILVVTGHVLGGLGGSGIVVHWQPTYRWMYAFHMPAFFFVAGLFATRSAARGPAAMLAAKAGQLAWPYLLWTVILWVCHELMSRFTHSAPDPWQLVKVAYSPYGELWFLYVLFGLFAAFAAVVAVFGPPPRRRVNVGRWVYLGLSLALYAAAQSGWPWVWSWPVLGHAGNEWVYLAVGVLVSERAVAWAPRVGRATGLAVAALAWAAVAGLVYLDADVGRFTPVVPALIGVAGCYVLAAAVDRTRAGRWLAVCGAFSLEIYLIHGLVTVLTRIALVRLMGVQSAPVHLATGIAVGLIVPVAIGLAVRRRRIAYVFSWPAPTRGDRPAAGAAAGRPAVPPLDTAAAIA